MLEQESLLGERFLTDNLSFAHFFRKPLIVSLLAKGKQRKELQDGEMEFA